MKRAGLLVWGVGFVLALPLGVLPSEAAWAQPPAAAEAPKSSDAAIKQYRSAVAFQNRQVYDLAIDEWLDFLKKHAQDPLADKAQHYLGVCYFQVQKYPEAQAAFEKVVAAYPNFELLSQTLVNLGLAQFNLGQQGDAKTLEASVATFQKLLEKFPQGTEAPLAHYYQAEALYSLNNKPEALAAYGALLTKFPQSELRSKALYGLGVAQEETGKSAEAGQTYDTFLKEFPKDELVTEVGMRRGETLLAQGQFADAEKRFAAAAAVPNFEFADYALLRQAVCQYELKQYGAAGKLYVQLAEKFPQSPYAGTATLAAGKCFYLAGDSAQAQTWLDKGRALGGEGAVESAHWQARGLLRDGKPAEALPIIEAALAQAAASPLLPDLKLDQADAIYELPDRRNETIALYAKLFAQHPQHEAAPQAGYMAAYAALGAGDHAAALTHADAFVKAFPEHDLTPDVLYVQAESQLQLRKYPEAEALYQQLLTKYAARPEAAQWALRRGLTLSLQKKFAEVVAALAPQIATLQAPEALAEAQFLIGGAQFELKQYPQAIAALQASLTAAPQWRQADETMLVLGRAQAESRTILVGDDELPVRVTAPGNVPDNSTRAETAVVPGSTLAEHRAAAIVTLQKLIETFPQSQVLDQAHFRIAEVQYAMGDYAASAAAYGKVLENWPDSPLTAYALYGLGWSQLSQQQYEPAATTLGLLIERHAEHSLAPKTRYARAMARQQIGQFDGAIADVAEFLKSNPAGAEKFDALYIRGLSEAGLKKFAEAGKTYQEILTGDPKYAAADKVLYELAWSHLSQEQQEPAAEVFARLGKEYPDSELAAEAMYRVGEHQYQNKKYPESARSYYAAFNKAGKTDLGEKAAHKLGWAYFQQKDFERAHQSYLAQVENYPQGALLADGLAMVGESLFQQKKYPEAYTALSTALKQKPSNDDFQMIALLHAGQAAGQLQKWQESLDLLKKLTTDFPESAYKQEALYEQAWAMQNLGQTAEAEKLYETVADAGDTVVGARARFMQGELLFAAKNYRDAIRVFFKVAYGYGYPESPEVYHGWQADATFEAARCCEMIQRTDVAKRLYKEVVDRYPQSDKLDDAQKKITALGG